MLIGIGLVLLLGQAPNIPIAIQSGSEVRLVSADLLTVFGTGRVEGGRLEMIGTLEPGQQLRLLIFPGGLDNGRRGEVVSSAWALTGVVSSNGKRILIIVPGYQEAIELRQWLQSQYGITTTFHKKEGP